MKGKKWIILIPVLLICLLSISCFADDYNSRENIIEIQKALNRAKYDAGPCDGIAGSKTKDAISRYKIDNDLPNPDIIDESLMLCLGLRNGERVYDYEKEMAAILVAFSNRTVTDIYNEDGKVDPSKFHSYGELAKTYMHVFREGTWSRITDNIIHVKEINFFSDDIGFTIDANIVKNEDSFTIKNIKGSTPSYRTLDAFFNTLDKSENDLFFTVPFTLLEDMDKEVNETESETLFEEVDVNNVPKDATEFLEWLLKQENLGYDYYYKYKENHSSKVAAYSYLALVDTDRGAVTKFEQKRSRRRGEVTITISDINTEKYEEARAVRGINGLDSYADELRDWLIKKRTNSKDKKVAKYFRP